MNQDDFYISGESPFYTDFLYKVQEDYPNAGLQTSFNNLSEIEKTDTLKYLYSHADEIISQFNLTYKYHELGSETEEKWQYTVDKLFTQIKREFNRYFMLYETERINELGKKYTESGNSTTNKEGSSSGTSSNKNVFKDTPITPLMETADYATNITEDDGSNESESSEDITNEYLVTREDKDKQNIELVQKNMDVWFDIITEFVDRFKVCFMDELTRV